jgi:hypothetical protein
MVILGAEIRRTITNLLSQRILDNATITYADPVWLNIPGVMVQFYHTTEASPDMEMSLNLAQLRFIPPLDPSFLIAGPPYLRRLNSANPIQDQLSQHRPMPAPDHQHLQIPKTELQREIASRMD